MKIVFLVLFTCLWSGLSTAEEKDAAGRFGPGKAVEAFSKEDGFKISDKAAISLNVVFNPIEGKGPWRLSPKSIVHLKQSSGVYRRYDGWISLVLVKVLGRDNGTVLVSSQDLEPGDDVAVEGVTFLRMTDSDLNSGTVDSCAH